MSEQDKNSGDYIRLQEINGIRKQIEDVKHEIKTLEKCLEDPSALNEYALRKSDIAADAISGAMHREIAALEEQMHTLKREHKDRLAGIDEQIIKEKEKVRTLLAKIDAQINLDEPKKDKASEKPLSGYDHYVKSAETAPEAEKTYSVDKATDEEIEMLVRELKQRKQNKTEQTQEEPQKVVEGFWDEEANTEKEPEEKPSPEDVSKHAFIIGKFAGSDLLDESGKLIIAKDEAITQETVEKAEAEGKLVDLIVDMKFS
jgi:hypothetical protein